MLNTIIRFSIKNKLIIGLMTVALIIWGFWSATKLPVDALPVNLAESRTNDY